jgi:energy-coupling factor transporter ATP-binding protein EcfA2
MAMAASRRRIDRIRWSALEPDVVANMQQGEHVAVIGPTGTGKTTLALVLSEARAARRESHVVILASKAKDDTLTAFARRYGWHRIREWPPDYEDRVRRRVILWPSFEAHRKETTEQRLQRQRRIFRHALDRILREGGWTVYVDEAIFFTETLNLRRTFDEYWHTARSSHISMIAASQGTTWVPRAMMTQQSWVFAFRPRQESVARDIADIAGDRKFEDVLLGLRRHEFLVVETVTGEAYVSKVGT